MGRPRSTGCLLRCQLLLVEEKLRSLKDVSIGSAYLTRTRRDAGKDVVAPNLIKNFLVERVIREGALEWSGVYLDYAPLDKRICTDKLVGSRVVHHLEDAGLVRNVRATPCKTAVTQAKSTALDVASAAPDC